jgi:lactoylglutathione lyase
MLQATPAVSFDRLVGEGDRVGGTAKPSVWATMRLTITKRPISERKGTSMARPDQRAELKFVVTNTLIVEDIYRSLAFYRDVLGATVLREGEPTFLRLGNIWLTINGGGGGTDDKPEVVASPPRDPNVLSIFLNLRVTDIMRYYDLWSSRGAKFVTEPKVHATELRCYMRDPDGYLIEVGQTTMTPGPLDLYA